MRIVAVCTCHLIQAGMYFIFQHIVLQMAVKTEGFTRQSQQFLLQRRVGIMTRGAISSGHGSVKRGITVSEILVTDITESGLRLHHVTQGIWIVTYTAFPLSVGIVNQYSFHWPHLKSRFVNLFLHTYQGISGWHCKGAVLLGNPVKEESQHVPAGLG
jgi:hypothetical protein